MTGLVDDLKSKLSILETDKRELEKKLRESTKRNEDLENEKEKLNQKLEQSSSKMMYH